MNWLNKSNITLKYFLFSAEFMTHQNPFYILIFGLSEVTNALQQGVGASLSKKTL
jgi:hypothetical protein